MKKVLFLLIGCLLFCSCKSGEEETSKLRIEHNAAQTSPIVLVSLLNYEFSNINISYGESKTFTLDKGMPAGYDDVYVTVQFGYAAYSIKKDFKEGGTTVIQLTVENGYTILK